MRFCDGKWWFLLFAILIFPGHVHSRIITECDKFAERSDGCWILHDEVPPCKLTYPLTACHENNVAQFPSYCPMKDTTAAQRMLGISQLLQGTVCAKTEIQEDFVSKPYCWESARICLARLPISFEEISYRYDPPLYDLELERNIPIRKRVDTVASECYKEGFALRHCQSNAIGCDLDEFIESVLSVSICDPYRIADCPSCAYNLTAFSRIVQDKSTAHRNPITVGFPYISIISFLLLYFKIGL